jgi:hypothetical protein
MPWALLAALLSRRSRVGAGGLQNAEGRVVVGSVPLQLRCGLIALDAGGSSGVEDTAGRELSAFGVVVAEPVLFASFGAGVAAGASTPVVVPAAASL